MLRSMRPKCATLTKDRAESPRLRNPGQALARRAPGGEGGQTLRGGAAVLLLMQLDHGLDAAALVDVEVAAGGEVLGQGAVPLAGPGLEGGDELALVDQ